MPEIDAVVIMASWESHLNLACDAMRAGKYTAVEVAGAYSVEDCWKLVRTHEETGVPLHDAGKLLFWPRRADGAEYGAPGPVRRGGALPGRLPPRPAGGGLHRARDAALPLPQLPVPELRKLPHPRAGPHCKRAGHQPRQPHADACFSGRPRPRGCTNICCGKKARTTTLQK